MIKNIYIDGVQINNDSTILAKLSNIGSASVDFSEYQRGGANGQVLSNPLYRGMAISMEWFVGGDDLNAFIFNRDRLIRLFSNKTIESNYLKTIGFEMADGVVKEIDVLFSQIGSNLSSKDINHCYMTVTAVSEREFLASRTEKQNNVTVITGGGMEVPMDVPMDMTKAPLGEITVVNNQGNSPAYPLVRIYGTLEESITLINDATSKTLSYTGELEADDYIDIDFYQRTAVKNGINSVLGFISGDWWFLASGTNQIRMITPTPTDTTYATMRYRDSYRNI